MGTIQRVVSVPFARVARAKSSSRLQLLQLAPRLSKPLTLLTASLVVIESLVPTAVIVATSRLVAAIASGRGVTSLTSSPDVLRWLTISAALLLLSQVFTAARTSSASMLGRVIGLKLRDDVIVTVSRPQTIDHLDDAETAAVVTAAAGVGQNRFPPGRAVESFAARLVARLSVAGPLVIILWFDVRIAAVLTVCRVVITKITTKQTLNRVGVVMNQGDDLRRADYVRDLTVSPQAAKEVRTFGIGDWLVNRSHSYWTSAMTGLWDARKSSRLPIGGAAAFGGAATTAAFAFLVLDVTDGPLQVTAIAMVAQSILRVIATAGATADDYSIEFGLAALPAVAELKRRVAEAHAGPRTESFPPFEALVCKEVSFCYRNRPDPVLRNVSLEIRRGESIAIVGPNGAGKTTLIKLFSGLSLCNSGEVSVNGQDLTPETIDAWRRQVAVLFQDFVRFELPARDNVGFGSVNLRDGSDRELQLAAEGAGVDTLIHELPAKWDTVLSRRFASGTDLSGGQWQKIALARVLFAIQGGASLVILDEPTSRLDVAAEVKFYETFLALTRGITSILISHRLSSVRHADRIYVFDQGALVDVGEHGALMSRDGLYAEMFRLQAAQYAADESVTNG